MHLGERFYTQEELANSGFKRLGRNVLLRDLLVCSSRKTYPLMIIAGSMTLRSIVASREPVTIGKYVHIASHCYISGSDGFTMDDFSGQHRMS
jgi:hypothetical protein